jgi:nicotinate-nucleotide pyrophosphorylase (carboxylating)
MSVDILDHPEVDRLIQLALDEDGVSRDLTTMAALGEGSPIRSIRATIVAKKPAISAGYPLVERVLRAAGAASSVKASTLVAEGSALGANAPWLIFEGSAADLLRLERVMLNFLIRTAGIAAYTREVVKHLDGTACKLLHTRKTAPGHRRTDVYAALVGGARAHRRSLDDAILVKENHLRVTPSFQVLIDGITRLRDKAAFVEIEVTDFVELKHALLAKPDRVLLDNFSVKDVERAVNLFGGSLELEASGSITRENVREYALTGVDYVSMGALTHSAPAADLSMLFDFTNT